MATEAQMSTNTDHESQSVTEVHDDCAITVPSATIKIPIFVNDDDHTPPMLRVSAVEGDLSFNVEGQAVYNATDQSAPISFLYQGEYDGSPTNLAKVFVLVSGELSKVVGDDVRLAKACSHGAALAEKVIDTPEAPLHGFAPGHHVTIVVDRMAGEIALDDPSLHPWKAITIDGGVDLFDPTGVIFLKGLTDDSNIDVKLLDQGSGKLSQPWPAEELRLEGELQPSGDSTPSPDTQPVEIADNRLVIYQVAAGEETHVATLPKTELPRCGECKVYAYDGQAYVVAGEVEASHVEGLQPWPDDLRFAGGLGWPWAFGQTLHPGPVLAANSDDPGSGAAAQSVLGAYWLEHDKSVVLIDDFFAQSGSPSPPELSIGHSQFVAADVLWNLRQPVELPGFGGPGTVYLIPTSAFPKRVEPRGGEEHGGGAGFTPYETGGIGEGLVPRLAQPPTDLAPRELPPEPPLPPPPGGNHGPVGEDDRGPLVQVGGAPTSINVLANDHDPDGDPLTIVVPGSAPDPTPLGGTVTGNGQELLYTPPGLNQLPDPDQPGRLVDRFGYTIDDGHSHQGTAQVTVPVNRAPEAQADTAQIKGVSVVIDVLTNDRDPDGDRLTILGHGQAQHGDVQVVNHDTQILYTRADAAEPLVDSFTYTIDDGRGGQATATVAVSDEILGTSPTLTIEPASVTLPVAGDFGFTPGLQPFPDLHEGQATDPGDGVDGRNLTLDVARTVTVSFVSENAGFHNSLGVYTYTLDANGAPTDPSDPQILFRDVDAGVLQGDPSAYISGLPGGTHLGLFLIPDGAGAVDGQTDFAFRETDHGHWELVPSDGGLALPVFFTTSEFNADGQIHALSGQVDAMGGSALRIGFEDLTGGGDRDFDDAVVQISYGHVVDGGLELTATIVDPDSADMAGASVAITPDTRQPGDSLFLNPDGILDGTGIRLIGEGTDELTFSGLAPSATYERALEAVRLDVGQPDGSRELVFQVSDDTQLPSNDAQVAVDLVPYSAGAADAPAGASAVPDHAALMATLVGADAVAA